MIIQKKTLLRALQIALFVFYLQPISASPWTQTGTVTVGESDMELAVAPTASRGNSSQKWNIARNISAGLTGVTYVSAFILKGVKTFSPDSLSCDLSDISFECNGTLFNATNATVSQSFLSEYGDEIEFGSLLFMGFLMAATTVTTFMKEKED